MNQISVKPTKEAIDEAKLHPNGWVYQIEGKSGQDGSVLPEAIVGAWKVDENGNIVGGFIPNPNYIPKPSQ